MASQSNAFMSNFMQGFSFVDDINSRRRQERKLDQRLAEDKEERTFQRGRQIESDQQVRENRAVAATERGRIAAARESRIRGDTNAARGDDATDDELLEDAANSPAAMAELVRRNGQARVTEALKTATNTIPQAGGQVTQSQGAGPQSLSEAVAADTGQGPVNQPQGNTAPGVPSMNPEERAIHDELVLGKTGAGTFQPSQGMSTIEQVSEEDVESFDPEFQAKGIAGQIADRFAGSVQQVTRAAGNLTDSAGQLRDTTGVIIPGPRATGAAISGDTFVPAEFVSKTEFDEIADPEERAQVEARNGEILEEQKARARNPSRNKLSRPITRQGAAQEGGELLRDDVQRLQNNLDRKYTDFLEGNGGQLETAALEEPSVAAVDYFENRATLQEMWGEDSPQMAAVDKRMVPVLESYAAELAAETIETTPGSPEHRQLAATQRNVNESLNTIAGDRPKAAQDASIRGGLKVGDHERVTDVVSAIYDPDRVTPSAHSAGQISSSATVAGRISPNKRLNDNQIEAVSILIEAGYIDKPTALGVMMTGAWPPGKNPNEIKKTVKAGNTTYAITEGGGYFVLPDVVGDRDKNKADSDRTLGAEQVAAVLVGASSTGMNESRSNQVTGLMLDHAGWVRQHFNTESQESMMALGRTLGQAVFLSASEHKRMSEDGFLSFTNPKNAPTAEEIFLNPILRAELAAEHKTRVVPMPAVGSRSDFDTNPFRNSLREGVHGAQLQADADNLSEEELLYVYWVLNADAEDIAAASQGQ